MSKKYSIEEIKNYIMSQDSLGDVLYYLTEENIDKANNPTCDNCGIELTWQEEAEETRYCLHCKEMFE
jgi:hypothetical protein